MPRKGPTTDHSGRTCFGQGCPFWDVLRHIRARRLTATDRNEGVYCHNDIATVGLGLELGVRVKVRTDSSTEFGSNPIFIDPQNRPRNDL